jgi:hypothetical protein
MHGMQQTLQLPFRLQACCSRLQACPATSLPVWLPNLHEQQLPPTTELNTVVENNTTDGLSCLLHTSLSMCCSQHSDMAHASNYPQGLLQAQNSASNIPPALLIHANRHRK